MVMQNQSHALSRDELIRVLTAYQGITTADGDLGGTWLEDANLIGSADFITEKTILIMSGGCVNQDRGAFSFNPVNGRIMVTGAYSGQIRAGTVFRVLNISSVELDVSVINAKIGTNADAPGTTTLFAYLAKILATSTLLEGLIFYGVVTAAVPGVSFTIAALAGLGAGKFNGATNPYQAYVLRDAGGGGLAPQGEMRAITGYTTATGLFTPNTFSAAVAVGDEILILHPALSMLPVQEGTGTIVYNEASALEQTVLTLVLPNRAKISSIWFDFVNVTQDTTIRVKHSIDGVNYRTFETETWLVTDDDGIEFMGFGAYRNIQVSFQCTGAGVGNVNVPYDVT